MTRDDVGRPVVHPPHTFVSRGGLKLRHALDVFAINVRGWRCADFGCNVGGFTDCLLQAGAASVYAIDTGYGALAWKLRQDPHVRVMERTNALHVEPPREEERVDLVVIDMGWTPQRLCLPAAAKWLRRDGARRIVTLVKPHYEASEEEKRVMVDGVLPVEVAERIATRVIGEMAGPGAGLRVVGSTRSPIKGGKGKGNARGNAEWLAVVEVSK